MRRRRPERRQIHPDPVYKDLLVAKFVNNLMLDGKKSIAEKIGVTTQTLMSWRKKGTGPKWVKLSRYIIRYPEADFNYWLENEHNKSLQQTNNSTK